MPQPRVCILVCLIIIRQPRFHAPVIPNGVTFRFGRSPIKQRMTMRQGPSFDPRHLLCTHQQYVAERCCVLFIISTSTCSLVILACLLTNDIPMIHSVSPSVSFWPSMVEANLAQCAFWSSVKSGSI